MASVCAILSQLQILFLKNSSKLNHVVFQVWLTYTSSYDNISERPVSNTNTSRVMLNLCIWRQASSPLVVIRGRVAHNLKGSKACFVLQSIYKVILNDLQPVKHCAIWRKTQTCLYILPRKQMSVKPSSVVNTQKDFFVALIKCYAIRHFFVSDRSHNTHLCDCTSTTAQWQLHIYTSVRWILIV